MHGVSGMVKVKVWIAAVEEKRGKQKNPMLVCHRNNGEREGHQFLYCFGNQEHPYQNEMSNCCWICYLTTSALDQMMSFFVLHSPQFSSDVEQTFKNEKLYVCKCKPGRPTFRGNDCCWSNSWRLGFICAK